MKQTRSARISAHTERLTWVGRQRAHRLAAWTLGSVAALASGCGARANDTGTETHWLAMCAESSDSSNECGSLECLCGVCTKSCSRNSDCPSVAPICERDEANLCGSSAGTGVCRAAATVLNPKDGGPAARADGAANDAGSSAGSSAPSTSDVGTAPTDGVRDVDAAAQGSAGDAGEVLSSCDPDGWCWQNPTPVGDAFYALSADGRFAVGERGVVFELPNRHHPFLGAADLTHVVASRDSVWVGSAEGLWSYHGDRWTLVADLTIAALVSSADGVLWGIGDGNAGFLDNGGWNAVSSTDLPTENGFSDLTVASDGSVWALESFLVGRRTGVSVFQWVDSQWLEYPTDHAEYGATWRFVPGIGEVYVYDSDAIDRNIYAPEVDWEAVASQPERSNALLRTGDGFLSATGSGLFRIEGSTSTELSDAQCSALALLDATHARCALTVGGIVDMALNASVPAPQEPSLNAADFPTLPTPIWAGASEAWASAPDDVWRAPLDHYDGRGWTSYEAATPTPFSATMIDGASPDDVWFSDGTSVQHYDGVALQNVALPSTDRFVSALRSFGKTSTWIVQRSLEDFQILQYDGANWNVSLEVEAATDVLYYYRCALTGPSATDLWAVIGHDVYHQDGQTWQLVASAPTQTLIDADYEAGELWVLGTQDVFRYEAGQLQFKGRASKRLGHIAVTAERIWQFDGLRYRTLEL